MSVRQLLPFNSAGLMLSYQCSARCAHCFCCCGPEWNGNMSEELLEKIVAGIKDMNKRYNIPPSPNPLFDGIHLSGGEAFLVMPLLISAVRLCVKYGVKISHVETNASWCTDEKTAVDRFTELKENVSFP